jgi:hypothetical protein
MLVFVEGGKPENLEKNPQSKGENLHNYSPLNPIHTYMYDWLGLHKED